MIKLWKTPVYASEKESENHCSEIRILQQVAE